MARTILEKDIGFLLVNVETGGADLARLDAGQQRLGVDERPARGVDDNDALLHLFDGGGVDHVDGLRRERAVQ